jgi:hypothetical protein
MTLLSRATHTSLVVLALGLVAACAAAPSKSAPASPAADSPERYGAPAGYPQEPASQPGYAQPPPPPPQAPGQLGQPPSGAPAQPGAGAAGGSRSTALQGAVGELESSQRELDVAAGDCRNACRALGSMDRAAGRLCELAQTSEEQRTCADAKGRVYSARDKVKSTCRSCPGGPSVESSAPIPSVR